MIAIIKLAGQDEEFVENVDAVVCEFPNEVRICKDGTEDRIVLISVPNGQSGGYSTRRTSVVVVP